MPNSYSQTIKCCALCQTSLTATNTSNEHIIPNAIGGRKTVRDFICKQCNSETGETWDSELAKQLQSFCAMLDISRKRGKNRPIPVETVSRRQLIWNPNGALTIRAPKFETRVRDGKTHVSIQARSQRDLKRMLIGLSRTRPDLNVKELLSQATLTEEHLEEPLHLSHQFGGPLAGRSITKTCLALAYDAGLSRNDCPHAIEYLVSDGHACFGYYNETDPVVRRPKNTPLHCVYLCANAATGLVLSYVEYFGFQKMVACLSSNYSGSTREHCYAVNPLTGEELSLEFELDLRKEDIAAIYDYKKVNHDRSTRDLQEMLSVWRKMDRDRAISNALDEAVADACLQLKLESEGIIPEEVVPEFTNLLFRSMAPLLLRLRFGRAFSSAELREIDDMLK